jgi:hypothetical protein
MVKAPLLSYSNMIQYASRWRRKGNLSFRSIMTVGRGENLLCIEVMYCSTQTRYRTIMVDDANLTSP